MRIIGLSGKAGAGKDTVADMIIALVDATARKPRHKIGFAYALKERAYALGWNGEKDNNGRILLQYIGNRERQDNPYYWVAKLFERIAELENKTPGGWYLIPDVRFVNEAETVRKQGVLWRIERPGTGLSGPAAQHSSETELDHYEFDTVIQNDGTLDDLRWKVGTALLETTGPLPVQR